MNMQDLFSVLEEDEENCDESRSYGAGRKLSNDLSPISNNCFEDPVNTQLVFFYISELENQNFNVKEPSYHLQSESKV